MRDEPGPGPSRRAQDSPVPATGGFGGDVLDHVSGLGATLAITATHVVLVREGAHFRPRTGVQSWPHDAIRDVQLVSPVHGAGRIVLRTGPHARQAVSLFVATTEWPAAERIVDWIHGRIRSRAGQVPRPRTATG